MRHVSRTQETEIALSNQGTHGATELATTLRPPEVSVWSGDIDLHICATNVDVKLLLFYFFPSDIK